MIRSVATLTASAKPLALVPDTIIHNDITWVKVSLAPQRHAWFYADGQFLLATEDGKVDKVAALFAPAQEMDMGADLNRRGTDLESTTSILFLAADEQTGSQLVLPATPGLGSEAKAMVCALEADKALKPIPVNAWSWDQNRWLEQLAAARASRARAEAAHERLLKKLGKPHRPSTTTATFTWRQDQYADDTAPVTPEAPAAAAMLPDAIAA